MAFSYDLLSSDAAILNISKVRMELGDNVAGSGVLPDGSNLSNEEIASKLAELDNSIPATVASLASVLARRWANYFDMKVGPRDESLSQVSKRWGDLAAELSSGGLGGGYVSFSVATKSGDGYSEAVDDGA